MTIEIKTAGNETVMEVIGRLDTSSAPVLDQKLLAEVPETANLTLDLKGLEYISSAGLRVLLSAQKRMQKTGSMKLKNVREEVMDVFEMTGFAEILVIE